IDKSQIGLIGHSLGGMVVLQNQALDDRFKATVAWAPLVSFDPKELKITNAEKFEDYIPENLLNKNNSKNLLIIHHVKDELVDYKDNAERAQELTGCKLIKITKSFGSPHQLISDKVIKKSINWFEKIFFNSETKNGPISISYIINYILLGISLVALFSTVFYFMNYISRYFEFKRDITKQSMKFQNKIPRKEVAIQITKIFTYFSAFIGIWLFATLQFGLIGLFYASIVVLFSYLSIKLAIYLIKKKKSEEKFNLNEFLKSQYDEGAFAYTIICTGFFLGFYIAFSIVYPFVFVFPSHPISILLALSVYPLYLCFEIFFRKILYPKLYFIYSRKSKTIAITTLAIINHIILISLNINLAFLPAVLVFYLLFLIVIIKNSLIYEKTKNFLTLIIASFIIIEIFFSAAISQALGIYSVLYLFL
ncbi:MAG: alpha/beta hydrolase family protein, partial [Promethearchaeota archaeon]